MSFNDKSGRGLASLNGFRDVLRALGMAVSCTVRLTYDHTRAFPTHAAESGYWGLTSRDHSWLVLDSHIQLHNRYLYLRSSDVRSVAIPSGGPEARVASCNIFGGVVRERG